MFACVSLEARKRPHSWISLIFWGRSIMRTGIRLGLGTEKPLPLELAGVGVKSAVGSLLGLYVEFKETQPFDCGGWNIK